MAMTFGKVFFQFLCFRHHPTKHHESILICVNFQQRIKRIPTQFLGAPLRNLIPSPDTVFSSYDVEHGLYMLEEKNPDTVSWLHELPMANADDEMSLYASGGAGDKFSKRPFAPEISEEPQNVSHEAGQNVSCLNTHQCGSFGGISATAGKSELEQTLKQMTFTRSECQHFMSLLQSRTMGEEPPTPLSTVATRQDLKMITKNETCLSKTPMASPQHPATMENLPDDLLSKIFIRLFAKQLAQMRSVSKSWNALLSHSSFIKSHLHHSVHKNDQILLVFHGRINFSRLAKPLTVKPTQSSNVELTNFIKLPVNPQPEYMNGMIINEIRIIGSVNGLICSSFGDSVIHIWNPSLSAMLTLPPYSMPADESVEIYFRFGYDPKTDDYKVVKLTGLTEPSKHIIKWWLQVEIYSMRKGSWKLITEWFPSHMTEIFGEMFACTDGHNGYLHWLCVVGDKDVSDTIVGFDLGSETFREIPLPISTRGHTDENKLGVLAEKLCVMLYNEGDDYEVWVMEEYGVAESWVKRHVFSPSFKYSYPDGITSCGEFLVDDEGDLVLYDPFANKQKVLEDYRSGGFGLDKIVEYVDSLVWVEQKMDGGGQS